MRRKNFLKAAVGGAATLLLAPLLSGCGGGADDEPLAGAAVDEGPDRQALAKSSPPADASTLTAEEIADMKFMREEEKLAHDVYVAMYARWGARVFSNIAASETEHTEAVLARLEAYGIADPAAGRAPGEFENAELQALYDRLVAAGSVSLVAALSVGALIEEKDIRDIRETMAQTDQPDVLRVYQNLLCGSYSHLLAFNQQLLKQGVSYASQVIPQAEWDAIVAGTATCTD